MLGIADLARAVGLNKSTTYRYVATLAKLGYVQQDPETKRYSLGPRVVDLGFAAINSMEITRVAAGYPAGPVRRDRLHRQHGRAGRPRHRLRRPPAQRAGVSNFAMGLHLHVGSRLPAYCTSMGKVLLASGTRAELRALLDRTDLARRGPKTITAREQLMAALARVRHTGIAVNDEELAAGLRSVAAPVRDRTGRVVAAVNIAIHLTVWNASVESVVSRLEGPLRHTVAEISRAARPPHRPDPFEPLERGTGATSRPAPPTVPAAARAAAPVGRTSTLDSIRSSDENEHAHVSPHRK